MKIAAALLLLILTSNVYANEMRFGISTGEGEISLSDAFNTEGSYAGDVVASGSIFLGYIFEDKYIVDLIYTATGNDVFAGLFDNIQMDSHELQFGYRFNFDKAYLEPRVGLTSWDIKLEEGFAFNPGPEQVSRDDGIDLTYAITAGYKFGNYFGLSLSYKHFEFDHGTATSTVIGASFEF